MVWSQSVPVVALWVWVLWSLVVLFGFQPEVVAVVPWFDPVVFSGRLAEVTVLSFFLALG